MPPPPVSEAEKKKRIVNLALFGAALAGTYKTGKDAFDGLDASKDGTLDVAEVAAAAGRFHYQGQAADLFEDLDTSKDGKITLSELTQFDRDYMPENAQQIAQKNKKVSWSPGFDGEFSNDRAIPRTGAHRRRTVVGLNAPQGKGIGIGPSSQVTWMRLGRTTAVVPVAWSGEYNDLGQGECATIEAHTPVFTDLINTPEGVCQGRCDTSVACHGFSWSRTHNTCRLWKESGLRGGTVQWGGCRCKTKIFDVVKDPVIASGHYARMGDGKCLSGSGKDYPESSFHPDVDENYCKSRCTTSTDCFGYSWSPQKKNCYLWKQTELRAPATTDVMSQNEACYVKIDKISQANGQMTDAPSMAAKLVGTVGGASSHAILMPLGRTISHVPVAWNGQWKRQAPASGRCMTAAAAEPHHRIEEGVDGKQCESFCGGDFSCYGFSTNSMKTCLLWMEPDLWGGGSDQGGYNCITKDFAVLTERVTATGEFFMAGPGLCLTGWDTKPASWYVGKVRRSECRKSCSADSTCTGFSWQPSGECANHYEPGLRSSGAHVGNIACYVKDFEEAINVGLNDRSPQFDMQEQGSYYEPSRQEPNFRGSNNGYPPAGGNSGNNGYSGGGNNGYSGGGNNGYYGGGGAAAGAAAGAGTHYVNGANGNNHQGVMGGWPSQDIQRDSNQQSGWPQSSNQNNGQPSGQNQGTGFGIRHIAMSTAAGYIGHKMMNGGGNNYNNNGNSQENRRTDWDSREGEFRSQEREESFRTHQAPTLPPYKFWTPSSSGSSTCSLDRPQLNAFPGKTAEQSNAAWPSGHQPQKGECWPKDNSTNNYKSCWYKKVLLDTDRGWPGKCSGLQRMTKADLSGLSCEEWCIRNVRCSVWQEVWIRGTADPVCYQGYGTDCAGIRSGVRPNVQRSQRLQHGSIRVLMKLKGMEIRNLKPVFDAHYFKRRPDALLNCRDICYSDILCQYWQYNSKDGCFVEHPHANVVAYPLTLTDVRTDTDFARTVLDGEYILHRCPKHEGDFTEENENSKFTMVPWEWNWCASHMPWDEGGWPWWGWLLFVLGCSCCCVCCMLFCGVVGLGKAVVSGVSSKDSSSSSKKGRSKGRTNSEDSFSSSDSESTVSSYNSYNHQKQKLLR